MKSKSGCRSDVDTIRWYDSAILDRKPPAYEQVRRGDRGSRGVRLAAVYGSLAAGLETVLARKSFSAIGKRTLAEFHRFQQLSRQLLDVNGICRLRTWRISRTRSPRRRRDGVRDRAGTTLLCCRPCAAYSPQTTHHRGGRGAFRARLTSARHAAGDKARVKLDIARRLLARRAPHDALVGSETSFEQGREQLDVLAGLDVTAKSVEMRGPRRRHRSPPSGANAPSNLPHVAAPAVPLLYIEMLPVVAAETKTAGRPARTREVKLGCVFTQTTTDEQGRPRRDENSTSYTAAIEGAEAFGLRLYTEAWRRGWSRARKKVILGDGAPWIWNLAHQHFPGAVEIVDLYHARQHLWELSAKLFPSDERRRKRWAARLLHKLEQGKIKALVKVLRRFSTPNQESAHLLANEADYFERNAERMRYPEFRRQGLFVGSGVVEAGCKKVIGARLKRSGMFWTVRGANAIIALRCCRLSGRFEDYWEARARAA